MAERFYDALISTKISVSIGPDGKILHHETISPQVRKVGRKDLGKALRRLGESDEPDVIKQSAKGEGVKTIWLSGDKSSVLAVTTSDN